MQMEVAWHLECQWNVNNIDNWHLTLQILQHEGRNPYHRKGKDKENWRIILQVQKFKKPKIKFPSLLGNLLIWKQFPRVSPFCTNIILVLFICIEKFNIRTVWNTQNLLHKILWNWIKFFALRAVWKFSFSNSALTIDNWYDKSNDGNMMERESIVKVKKYFVDDFRIYFDVKCEIMLKLH